MACDLTVSIAFDCENPESAVVRDQIYLLPYDSLDGAKIIYDVTDPYILTSIGLVTGSQAVKYTVAPDTVLPTTTTVAGANNINGFNHSVIMNLPTKTAEVRNEVRLLNNKKVVLVLQTGSGEFLVYGLDSGVKITELSDSRGDENGDSINMTLATAEGRKEPTMEVTLLDTDEATTKALLEALLTPQA